MSFFALAALINAVTSIVLGMLVLFQNFRSRVYGTFALFAASITVWSAAYFYWQTAADAASALFWTHLLMAGAAFIPFFYYHFITEFLGTTEKHAGSVIAGYLFAVAFSAASFTSLIVQGLAPKLGFPYWPNPGPLLVPFLAVWFFYIIHGTYLLYARYRESQGEARAQVGVMLVAMIVGYAGGATNYFLWFGLPIPPYGNISASFFVVMMTYAILRYHLFNLKVIATELLVFTIWVFSAIQFLAENHVMQTAPGKTLFALGLFLAGYLIIRAALREVLSKEEIEAQGHALAAANVSLAAANQRLEKANRGQEALIHFLSHEVKGYLTKGQAAFAAITEGDFGQVSPALKGMAESALADTRQGVDTVMNILSAGNLKKGTVTFTMKPFDFAAMVRQAVEEARPAAEAKGLELTFNCPGGLFWMKGDESQLKKHVVGNLLNNAIAYTPAGFVRVGLSRDGDVMRLTVTDSGVGITKEDMARLFTEGGRGKESTTVNVHSTGYGLFIAKSIVEAHGGRMWAESEGRGRGARVGVALK